jgi:Clp amino terminal domain, pathogenicity island component/UvrB/uvrC motif
VFERFTEQARQVVVLAQEEARGLTHNYIGTEHILLGLLREERGLAARVLGSFDVTLERVRAQVVRIVGFGEEATEGQIPFTPRARKVLELALRESLSLGQMQVDTEHLLLGLAREGDGVAARILRDFDADPEKIRTEVMRVRPTSAPQASGVTFGSSDASQRIAPGWLDGLGLVLNGLADEIRHELGREPDGGDLLLVLSAARDSVPAEALEQLGVDVDELWGQVEHHRRQAQASKRQLAEQIEQARLEKERAIESQQFQAAARHRDQERRLTEQQRAHKLVSTETLQAIRHRLGLPTAPDRPTGT